jgi:fluoride exporter
MFLMRVLLIGLGGATGSILRYGSQWYVYSKIGVGFPWGTLFVNIFGSFLIGALIAFFELKNIESTNLRLFLTVGLLGGFTTFSTFSAEVMAQIKEAQFLYAGFNIVGTVVLVLFGYWLGDTIVRLLFLGATS